MKLIRKFMEFLLTVLILAALCALVWHFYGDYIKSQVKALVQIAKTAEEDAAYSEQTMEMRQILEQAYTVFLERDMVECEISRIYPEDPAREFLAESNFTWNMDKDIMREKIYTLGYTRVFMQGAYNPDTYLSDSWLYFDGKEGYDGAFEVTHMTDHNHQKTYDAEPNTWYYFQTLYHDPDVRKGEFSAKMPYALLRKITMKEYEKVGVEECNGKQAIHYVVTHKPLMRHPEAVLEEQYSIYEPDGTATGYAPLEYYEMKIAPGVQETYPEFYASFMELVEEQYYKDNRTHFWITEEGELLRIEYDYTFESYEASMIYNDFDRISGMLEEVYPESGELVYKEFAELQPVTRRADFVYDEQAEAMVIPEEYISLVG